MFLALLAIKHSSPAKRPDHQTEESPSTQLFTGFSAEGVRERGCVAPEQTAHQYFEKLFDTANLTKIDPCPPVPLVRERRDRLRFALANWHQGAKNTKTRVGAEPGSAVLATASWDHRFLGPSLTIRTQDRSVWPRCPRDKS